MIDANVLEEMAKDRPDECFLKGSGVLKLIQAIRELEREIRTLKSAPAPIVEQRTSKPSILYDQVIAAKSEVNSWPEGLDEATKILGDPFGLSKQKITAAPDLITQASRYLQALAPHAREREGAQIMRQLVDALSLRQTADRIDAAMSAAKSEGA